MATENVNRNLAKPVADTRLRTLSPFEELDRYFDNVFGRSWLQPFGLARSLSTLETLDARLPKVDVVERDSEILVRAEVPGVDKKNLEISVTENTITIKGSTAHEEKEEKGNYYRSEITKGQFARTVGLPSDVNSDEARASFRDGVVEVIIPKIQRAKRRNIVVE
ncbi:MAG: Hsp20/alpha crystallin family protein [Gammaproteobacteria bacterium]|nr:Hsp20/alpha crystallin family protein [Gammaproteobacteria bacterium]